MTKAATSVEELERLTSLSAIIRDQFITVCGHQRPIYDPCLEL